MPFDSLHAPPEWREPKRREEPEQALTRRDRIVIASMAIGLGTITLFHCLLLLAFWRG